MTVLQHDLDNLEIVEIKKQISMLWKAVEGNALDPGDWFANSRLFAKDSVNSESVNLTSSGAELCSIDIETDGGLLICFATCGGAALNSVFRLYATVDEVTVLQKIKVNAIDFYEVIMFSVRLDKGKHSVKLCAELETGTCSVGPGGARMIAMVPGRKLR